MPFPKRYAEIAARTRVPVGFFVGVAFLILARPTWISLGVGSSVALLGLWLRAWAAGHLAKNERLATSGPFAHTRNPLYLGTLIVGLGFAVAGARIGIGVLLVLFFVLFYLPVVEEEERHLRKLFPAYAKYESQVPRLWPRLTSTDSSKTRFSFAFYKRNQEHRAAAGFLLALGLLVGKLLFLS